MLQRSTYNKSSVWVPVSLFVSEHVTAIRPMFFPVSEFFTKFLYRTLLASSNKFFVCCSKDIIQVQQVWIQVRSQKSAMRGGLFRGFGGGAPSARKFVFFFFFFWQNNLLLGLF